MGAREIGISELAGFCESLARGVMSDHEKRFADRVKSIRDSAGALDNAASRFAGGVKNAWGTLDKTASDYGLRMVQSIRERAQLLARQSVESGYRGTEKYHQEAVESLNSIIVTVRRYVPKLHRALKAEIASLNSALVKLEVSVKSLGAALDASPGLKLESLERDVQLLIQKHSELANVKSNQHHVETSAADVAKLIQELRAKKEVLGSKSEFLELKRYEDEFMRKEEVIKQFLQPLIKPLLKLEREASAKEGLEVDVGTLQGLIGNPIETITTGQSFARMQVLDSLQEALKQGKLEIEERKRRKAYETIQIAKQGTLDRLRDEYLTLQANIQETLRQLKAKGLLEQRGALDLQIEETRTQMEARRSQEKELQRKADELDKAISKLRVSIELQISKIAHRSIRITDGSGND